MVAIIDGPNGKYVLATITYLGLGIIGLCALGLQLGYSPSISYGNVHLTLSKCPPAD